MLPQQSDTGISIILPVHNEQDRIEIGLKYLLSFCQEKNWDFELVLVEDASTDSTVALMRKLCLLDDRIKMLSVNERLGKGGAIIAAAMNMPLKKYMTYMDIDLSAQPSELEKLMLYADNYDVVIGSRILHSDSNSVKRPYYRSILSHLYSKLYRVFFRTSILDPQCGLKLFRNDVVKNLFDALTISDFAFDTDLILMATLQRLKIKEVPINWQHGSSSKVHVHREIKLMGLDLILLWYKLYLLEINHKSDSRLTRGAILGKLALPLLKNWNQIEKRILKHQSRISAAKLAREEIYS